MTRSFRRFEVLLPLRFNDGQPVPDGLIADTVLELFDQFGAVSSETQTIRGRWGLCNRSVPRRLSARLRRYR
jgi:predicted Zn-dependent protease